MVLDQVILSTQHNEDKLSRLAAVNRKWQERIEKLTFATLGGFTVERFYDDLDPLCSPSSTPCSPFRATDSHKFQRIVVGKRRTILRHITIDFNLLNARGTPESQDDGFESLELLRGSGGHIRGNSIVVHRCKWFGYYTNLLFFILHTWDASQVGPSYLNVTIRVCDGYNPHYLLAAVRMYANLTKLPQVSVFRSFEFIHNPRGRDPFYCSSHSRCMYVHPNSINQILGRLSFLHSAIIYVQLPLGVDHTWVLLENDLRDKRAGGKLNLLIQVKSCVDAY